MEADLLRGEYIDPSAGKITFEAFATQYLDAQTNDGSWLGLSCRLFCTEAGAAVSAVRRGDRGDILLGR